MIAVFRSSDAAHAARGALLDAGFDAADVTLSMDFTHDAVAAEAPGQAYENQQTKHHAGMEAWIGSFFTTIVDNDTADAQPNGRHSARRRSADCGRRYFPPAPGHRAAGRVPSNRSAADRLTAARAALPAEVGLEVASALANRSACSGRTPGPRC